MNGESIPGDDHVLRHVKARFIQGEEIDGSAFSLRPGETQLSFNWMEYYRDCRSDEQLRFIRETFPLQLKKRDKFAKLNVGFAKQYIAHEHPENKVVNFIEDASLEVPSHCLMTGEPDIDAMMGELLLDCILETFPAMDSSSI